jgi:hypothetical protein
MKQDERITRRHHNSSHWMDAAVPELDEVNNKESQVHRNVAASARAGEDVGRPRPGRRRPYLRRRNQFSYLSIQRQVKLYLRRNPEKVYTVAAAAVVAVWMICWAFSTLVAQHRQQQPLDLTRSQHHSQLDADDTNNLHHQNSDPLLRDYVAVVSDNDGTSSSLSSMKQRGGKKSKLSTTRSIHNHPKARPVPKSDKPVADDLDTRLLESGADVSSQMQVRKAKHSKATPKLTRTLKTMNQQVPNNSPPFSVVFPPDLEPIGSNLVARSSNSVFMPPKDMDPMAELDGPWMDFGGLNLKFFEDEGAARQIERDYELLVTDFRDYNAKETTTDDEMDKYYAFDDDYVRNEVVEEQHGRRGKRCRRVAEHRLNFQNCNTFHETSLLESNVKYLK